MTKYILAISIMAMILMGSPTNAMASQMVELIEVEHTQPTVTMSGESLRVTGATGQYLQIYNIAGVCILTVKIESADCTFDLKDLAKGCYIFKVGKVTRKVSIK